MCTKDGLKLHIECPICHKKYKMITNNHLVKKHNITLEEFRNTYKGYPTESEYLQKVRVDVGLAIGSKESVKSFRSAKAKKQHESGNLNPSKTLNYLWENKRDWMRERQHIGNSTEAEFKRKSEVSRRLWSCPEWVNSRRDRNVRCELNGYVLYVRSSYEKVACEFLDSLGVKFEYETKVFKYYYDGRFRNYIVDLYLPLHDIYLEVKPKDLESDDKNKAKLQSVIDSGNIITYVDEDWICSIDDFKHRLSKYIKI
jgi:hypothetical protein